MTTLRVGVPFVVAAWCAAACNTGQVAAPKRAAEPEPDEEPARKAPVDRVAKLRKAREAVVPAGSTCLPLGARDESELRLELGAIGDSARLCAFDIQTDRLLGPVACWNIDLTAGSLVYSEPAPLPGRGFAAKLEGSCAHGYCLPEAPKPGKTAQIAWSVDGKSVALLVDRKVHLFDAVTQNHAASFSVEQPGVALHHLGTHVVVQSRPKDGSAVWVYEADGTQVGQVMSAPPGAERPLTARTGGLSLLDPTRIAIGERGFEEMTVVDLASGTRTRIARKPATRPKCKVSELESYWNDPEAPEVGPDCKASINATLGPLVGATMISGRTNFLALLRGERAGVLAVLDAKTLAEKRAIPLPWCTGNEKPPERDDDEDDDDDDDDDE